MKWMGRRQSDNLEDRRGISGGHVVAGGGIIGIIILLVNLYTGNVSPVQAVDQMQQMQSGQQSQKPLTAQDKKMGEFVNAVLVDTEDVWSQIFQENGMTYEKPKLVLFRDAVETGCGDASSQVGPFYCPEDRKVYLDLGFFDELHERFGAKGGDFAIAYVIAHEIGHHVQNLLGISDKVREKQQMLDQTGANRLSVALELQADFYAGVWANRDQKLNDMLEPGDIDEAMDAANAVGDDALQRRLQGTVVPDSFTHGTSAQRMSWFRKGFDTGEISQGDTFASFN
jgi:predicted metalloprotease